MTKQAIEQSYAPWRQQLLTRDELQILSRPNFSLSARKAAEVWLQMICCWGVAAWLYGSGLMLSWLGIAVCSAMVGNRYYALYILGHDGLHRRLHPNAKLNDWFNDILCIGPIGAVTHRNRSNHMRHHRYFATDLDPDGYKYESRSAMRAGSYLLSLTALPFVWRAVMNVYRGCGDGGDALRGKLEKLTGRDLAIIVGWQVVLASSLMMVFGWWGYLVMWILPIYIFTFAADMVRVYCEHSLEGDKSVGCLPVHEQWMPRCVTFMPGPLELVLFAPLNMNHHAAHHLWPGIPWYNLPLATKLLNERIQAAHPEGRKSVHSFHAVRSSYMGWLLRHRF